MERKKRRNWILAVMLTIAVTFSNVCPVTAVELPDQMALEKVEKAATPSNAQKPGAGDGDLEDSFEDKDLGEDLEDDFEDKDLGEDLKDGFEDKDLGEDLEDGFEDEDLGEDLEDGSEDEDLGEDLEDDLEDEDLDDVLQGEAPENFVWVWSDKAPVLMEAEEGDDLTNQLFGLSRASGICPTYDGAYEAMTGMKEELYEGMTWTNFQPFGNEGEWGKYYRFQGGPVKGASLGVGCAAFVFMLSDEAFGDLPARTIDRGGFKYEDVKVGDILRVNNNHFVIVLRAGSSGVTVAEGNYNKSVHWGRSMSKPEVLNANFIVTRYPAGYSEAQDAEEVSQSGKEGSLSWTLTNGGTLTISGNGVMPDYTKSNRPTWEPYDDKINQVVIENGVENVGNYAFYQSPVMGVQIPETVTGIGEAAFAESGLTGITVPGSVKEIGAEALYNCPDLKSATFYEGVQSIGVNAFRNCGIAYLDFPASVTSVGAGAFMECKNLVQVRFAPGEQSVSLGDDLFSKCWKLSDVTLPLKADRISSGMFANCYTALTYLYIPKGVRVDGMGDSGSPFAGCSVLQTIDFGGTSGEWGTNGGPSALNYAGLKDQVKVNFNVDFDDPFAEIPGDPGEFVTCDHVDKDGDGSCDICGIVLSADPSKPGGSEDGDKDPVNPDDGQKPGDTGNNGSTSGGNTGGSSGGSSGSSGSGSSGGGSHGSGSSGGSSSGSSSSGGGSHGSSSQESSSSTGEGVNKVISTNTMTNEAGEKVETAKWSDGTVVVTTTDGAGAMRLEVELPKQTPEAAQREDKATMLPIAPVQVTNDITKAMPITIHTDKETPRDTTNPAAAITDPVKILVPVTATGAGTVAVLVKPDGSTQIIEDSTLIEGGMVVPVLNGDTVKIVDRSRAFADVPADAWYKEAVDYVTARDLFHGVTEATFNPAAHMTCATLVTALAQLEGLDALGGATWYERGVSWAVASGVMDAGVNPESTATSDLIKIYEKYFGITLYDALPVTLTRAEAAQMLLNLKRCRP